LITRTQGRENVRPMFTRRRKNRKKKKKRRGKKVFPRPWIWLRFARNRTGLFEFEQVRGREKGGEKGGREDDRVLGCRVPREEEKETGKKKRGRFLDRQNVGFLRTHPVAVSPCADHRCGEKRGGRGEKRVRGKIGAGRRLLRGLYGGSHRGLVSSIDLRPQGGKKR